jgi:hypothetical protein
MTSFKGKEKGDEFFALLGAALAEGLARFGAASFLSVSVLFFAIF